MNIFRRMKNLWKLSEYRVTDPLIKEILDMKVPVTLQKDTRQARIVPLSKPLDIFEDPI